MGKRKPLTAAQRVENITLREIWDRKGIEGQGKFGQEFDIGDQGLVTQYLNSVIPLNLEVAIKFAKGLGVAVGDFAPRFEPVLAMVPGYQKFDPDERLIRDDAELKLLKVYRALPEPYRDALMSDVSKYPKLMRSSKKKGLSRPRKSEGQHGEREPAK